jgi:hypothetical protein
MIIPTELPLPPRVHFISYFLKDQKEKNIFFVVVVGGGWIF